MSLIFAQMGNELRKKELEKMVNGLVSGKEYFLYSYGYNGLPEPKPFVHSTFLKREKDMLYFYGFYVRYCSSYNPMVDVLRGLPQLILEDLIAISKIIEKDDKQNE